MDIAVNEPIYNANSIIFTLNLNSIKPLEDAKPIKTVRSTKMIKLAASSKITKVKKLLTSLTYLFYYGNLKRSRI